MARDLQTEALLHEAKAERPRLDPDLLTYRLLRPREVGLADVALIGEAYRVWSEVWAETFLELDGQTIVPSDQFTRQDEVGAVFHGYECVGLSCFRWVDLSLPMTFADSYFESWPQSARDSVLRLGPRVCIGSQITIPRPWRKTQGHSLSALVTSLGIERFLRSDTTAMLGTMRDDRGMGAMIVALGAEAIGQAQLHGVPVSLIAVHRGRERLPLDPRNEEIVRRLAETIEHGAP